MAKLNPTGLETITYGQQGWNAVVSANMQRLNGWLGLLWPLVNAQGRVAGAVPVWNASASAWEASDALETLKAEVESLKARVEALEPPQGA